MEKKSYLGNHVCGRVRRIQDDRIKQRIKVEAKETVKQTMEKKPRKLHTSASRVISVEPSWDTLRTDQFPNMREEQGFMVIQGEEVAHLNSNLQATIIQPVAQSNLMQGGTLHTQSEGRLVTGYGKQQIKAEEQENEEVILEEDVTDKTVIVEYDGPDIIYEGEVQIGERVTVEQIEDGTMIGETLGDNVTVSEAQIVSSHQIASIPEEDITVSEVMLRDNIDVSEVELPPQTIAVASEVQDISNLIEGAPGLATIIDLNKQREGVQFVLDSVHGIEGTEVIVEGSETHNALMLLAMQSSQQGQT